MVPNYPNSLPKTRFCSLWYSLPELKEAVDPFDFEQRMAILKRLIDGTNEKGIFGPDNRLNVFWGYVFQTHWQYRSGRYGLAATPPGRIDPDSLWGYSNFTLTGIPLIAAMETGVLPEMEILPSYTPSRVVYPSGTPRTGSLKVPAVFHRALENWRAFFSLIQETPPGGDIEPVRFQLWKAHGLSLDSATQSEGPLVDGYSHNERAFLSGWGRMVDFLEKAAWRTDIDFMLENGLDVLPERILTDEDIPGHMEDQPDQVNRNTRNMFDLVRLPPWRFQLNLWMWRRAMRSRAARDDVLAMLDATFNPSPKNVQERRRLLRYMLAL